MIVYTDGLCFYNDHTIDYVFDSQEWKSLTRIGVEESNPEPMRYWLDQEGVRRCFSCVILVGCQPVRREKMCQIKIWTERATFEASYAVIVGTLSSALTSAEPDPMKYNKANELIQVTTTAWVIKRLHRK